MSCRDYTHCCQQPVPVLSDTPHEESIAGTSTPYGHAVEHRERRGRFALALALASLLGFAAFAVDASAATFRVNSTDDDADLAAGDGLCGTGGFVWIAGLPTAECTLRAAIQETNALAGFDTIEFSAAMATTAGFAEISPTTALPWIADPVLIDGYSHPAYMTSEPNAVPVVNLLGGGTPAGTNGLVLFPGAEGSTIRGLAVSGFSASGILVSSFFGFPGPQNVTLQGNHVGVWRGLFYSGNGAHGVDVTGTALVTIGADCNSASGCPGRGNVISGNGSSGVRIESGSGHRIAGNFIGTDFTGLGDSVPFGGATGNSEYGVLLLDDVMNAEIGSIGQLYDFGSGTFTPVASGNVISGNGSAGLAISGVANLVRANRIGTDVIGARALPNAWHGIVVSGSNTQIGGVDEEGNVVSGNAMNGIFVSNLSAARDVLIEGNLIGVDASAGAALGNGWAEISTREERTTISGNVIGGNGGFGIDHAGSGGRILANWIGTNQDGLDLGNAGAGISASGGGVYVGDIGQGNVIGFNDYGIGGSPAFAFVIGNWIGTNVAGEDLGNDNDGVAMSGAFSTIGEIDGRASGAGNTIGFNKGAGITTSGIGTSAQVFGNWVGTNAGGDDLGNHIDGIVARADGTIIGAPLTASDSDVPRYANEIAHHESGVAIGTASQVTTRGNFFHSNDVSAIDLEMRGPLANDSGDLDEGPNRLQNTPVLLPAVTRYLEEPGAFEITYLVDSLPTASAYPLKVDFYFLDPWRRPGDQVSGHLGSDSYTAGMAGSIRTVFLQPDPSVTAPPSHGFVSGAVLATATDADGNTSELSLPPVPVPEPVAAALLLAGLPTLAGLARIRKTPGCPSGSTTAIELTSPLRSWRVILPSLFAGCPLTGSSASALPYRVSVGPKLGSLIRFTLLHRSIGQGGQTMIDSIRHDLLHAIFSRDGTRSRRGASVGRGQPGPA